MVTIAEYFRYTIENLPRKYWYDALKGLFDDTYWHSCKKSYKGRVLYTRDESYEFDPEYYFSKESLKADFKGKFNIGDIVKFKGDDQLNVLLVIIKIPALDIRNETFNYSDIKNYGDSYIGIGYWKVGNSYQIDQCEDITEKKI